MAIQRKNATIMITSLINLTKFASPRIMTLAMWQLPHLVELLLTSSIDGILNFLGLPAGRLKIRGKVLMSEPSNLNELQLVAHILNILTTMSVNDNNQTYKNKYLG